ncbi:sushi, von Willebrand factor type A, EGF and pentraxin domain-containing protein 1-like [Saccostrea echinata]|uniref:sushi, von Willebrand factor type A, EGF and pentraxin domain-containing protein 1-like n=1 Tax=Saccostrea echinata TaxID=191078 RepID=UPI002A80D32C|nr:sushi, von Willebrand factor type A, EGF and pentraxin domain-containing protein 1-like [Saccostrea echinata]
MYVSSWTWNIFYLCVVFPCFYNVSISLNDDDSDDISNESVYIRTEEEIASKSKVDSLGPVLKRHIQALRQVSNKKVDIVFLVDSSASVGPRDFNYEIKFVRKLLADFTVDTNHTRVCVITFSSKKRVLRQIDYVGQPLVDKNKCTLLEEDVPSIRYVGGGTYTLGAFLEAKKVLSTSRSNSEKAIFLVTDGFSNGGDPRPEAKYLRDKGVKIFTFGIRNGNVRELVDMASEPKNETSYILDSFEEFEALARRALHEDLGAGSYVAQPIDKCHHLCIDRSPCCDQRATCRCGTHTGNFECVCREGFYGTGLYGECYPCPSGTYKDERKLGDESTCKKCPDENQSTQTGATHVSQCSCKKGFRTFNGTGCSVLRCPELKRPKNGYFVNDYCDSVFNAACGIKCKPGYELRGNSLRICQEDGHWSGETAECVMKTCPPLPKPKHGNMICDHDDFSFSTVCRFTCDTGYKLVGSRKRECLAIAYWTGIPTRCKEITCQPLPQVREGVVKPLDCTANEVSFGTICQVECAPGYSLEGPERKQCTPEGMWAPESFGEMSRCEDKSPPNLFCPADIQQIAPDDDNTVEIMWQPPLALDNSGLIPILTVVPAVEPPKRFPIGVTYVKYIAEDLSGNREKCRFSVVIRDVTPPRVDSCFSPNPFVSSTFYAEVIWDEPQFSDNSGETPRVERTHAPGLFPRGLTIVTYRAFDESGNNNTCELEIQVIPHPCQYPPEPVNGERHCYETTEGVYCNVTCNEGFAFAINPADVYFCAYDNIWTPIEKMPIPDCSVQTVTNSIELPASVTYISNVPCRDHLVLNQMQNNFFITLSGFINGLCDENMICEVDDVDATCEEEVEDFNRIKIILDRKRRDIVRIISKESGKDAKISDREVESSITFDFLVRGQYRSPVNPGKTVKESQKVVTERLKGVLTTVKTEGSGGMLDLTVGGTKAKFANLTVSRTGPQYKCKEGGVLVNTSCVKCPVGTFFNVVLESCSGCPVGTYQPLEGSVSCLVCPVNTTTDHNNSKSQEECKAQCLPGTYSKDGLERCATCEIGFYQTDYGQTSCRKCPPGTTTKRRGARIIEKCEEPCEPGFVSSSGLKPCFPCPKGTYQSDTGQTACFECPGKTLTQSIASTEVTDCSGSQNPSSNRLQADEPADVVVFNACFENPCHNGSTCRARPFGYTCDCAPGYKGINCDVRINHCEGAPCLNGGTCNNHLTNYSCDCSTGFRGDKCEVNVDDCASMPCENNGTCQDLANGFTCSCPAFFKGPTCNVTVDFCTPSPCLNNGICHPSLGGYTCSCPSGFRGTNCEINHDECDSGPCQNGGSCEDGIATYRCQCLVGFTGDQCEVNIDDCDPDPCVNATRCEDGVNRFTCHCLKGFIGDRCERELEVEYLLDFPFAGTFNYTAATIERDLTSVSVSFWMKTSDTTNQGTPFSYASDSNMDNALTMTSYDGFVLYVNNQQKTTDVIANDGKWHHLVFTWSSSHGAWKIYIDGVVWDSGFSFAAGHTIKGGGKFVIGQEQDKDGSYNSAESFIGQITHLNVWDRELTFDEINSMRTSCRKFIGNVIAWPDIQTGLHGSLKPEPSNFCRGCPVPVRPIYGHAAFSSTEPGATVKYSCLPGFNFLDRDTRQCLVTGEWSGRDLQCQRVYCGFPQRIRNGFIDGRDYYYESTVRYRCDNNYRLKGSERLYCNENGTWEGETPTCEEITCQLPLLSGNTIPSINKQHYRTGETVNFSCKEGYKLLTDHDFVSCQKDGTWDRSVPTCDPQTCKTIPPINNGEVSSIKDEYSVGHILTFTCDYGYRLSDTNPTGRISCLPNGQWESNVPQCEIVTCPNPPSVLNAMADLDGLTFLSSVTYTCKTGYELVGETDILECVEDGTWDPLPPECVPVECGDPGLIANGDVLAPMYTFGSLASYRCNPGYFLSGNNTRKCESDKEWSGEAPTCSPVSCGQTDNIENGIYEQNGNTFGSIATYGCLPGYDLHGIAERTCEANGLWSGSPPGCTKKECGAPPIMNHGQQRSSGVYYQDTVTYSCELGYRLNGVDTLHCGTRGRWEPSPPLCEEITCPTPETIQYGNYTLTGKVFGSIVDYFCLQGYKLATESARVCQPDGTWSSSLPSCVADECPPPLPVENGKFDFKDRQLGSVVLYSCNPGYKLVGSDVRRCVNSLTWSGNEPVCAPKSCMEPEDITNGRRNASGLLYNAIVTYECDAGYLLRGPSKRTCQSSGAWSGTAPTCEIVVCDTPSKVTSNGRSFGNSSTYNSVVTYECDPGYNLNGAKSRRCLANGQWDFEIPICEVVQCPRPHLSNGIFSNFKTEYLSNVTFQCRSGYVLFGASKRTCLESGLWSGQSPICVKRKEPPVVEYATVLSNGNSVIYSCLYGYKMVGNTNLQFDSDGRWHGDKPECVPIECNATSLNIDNFAHGIVEFENITLGSTAEYRCERGYELLGDATRTCLFNGFWSGSNPICNIVFCPGNFEIQHGSISGTAYHFNASLRFACMPGYQLVGDEVITCLENSSWSGSNPRCERITCPAPRGSGDPSVSFNTLTVGSTVEYRCSQTHKLIGESSRTCLPTGQWSGQAPSCQIIQCKTPSFVNGRVNVNSNTLGGFMTYACDEGYRLEGISWRFCTSNETWSGTEPSCIAIKCSPPRSIDNGMILDNGRTEFFYGDMVRYKCTEGYVMQGGDTDHICQGSGSWSGSLPTCVSVACGSVPYIPHSRTTLLNGTMIYNSVVKYTCAQGYKSQSGAIDISKCQPNGAWSVVTISCSIVHCPAFPSIAHGTVVGKDVAYGSRISVVCDNGFSLVGDSQIRCLSNGSWSITQTPRCQQILCPTPESTLNGNVYFTDITVGVTINYTCNTGFKLIGDNQRRCSQTGEWTGSVPVCQEQVCGEPPVFPNAVISVNRTEYPVSESAQYSCLPGYTMSVQSTTRCNSVGIWEGSGPSCTKIKCEQPRAFENGRVQYNDVSFGSKVTFTCNEGYILSGASSMSCLETGIWSSSTPICQPVSCPSPAYVENSIVVGDVYTYGNMVTYICNEGYEQSGARDLICQADGTWSSTPSHCQKVQCRPPPAIAHARVKRIDFFFKDKVTYECEEGYNLIGNATLQCGFNSSWLGVKPRCEIISCGDPPEVTHATSHMTRRTYNAMTTYMCDSGYTRNGDPIATCTANATWALSADLSCVPVDCGFPPNISNAVSDFASTTYLSYVVYRCSHGYTLHGNSRVQCREIGVWDTALPVCLIANCPPPVISGNVIIIKGSFSVGDTVEFGCSDGHIISGNSQSTCTSSGMWSSSVPVCKRVRCPMLSLSGSGLLPSVNKDDFVFGDHVSFTCTQGYVIVGGTRLECQSDGTWSGSLPTCTPQAAAACPIETRIPNTQDFSQLFPVGHTRMAICKPGYEEAGSLEVTCQATRKWSSPSGYCRKLFCGKPPVTDMVNIIRVRGRSYFYKDQVRYQCRPGIPPMKIPPVITCTDTGQWDGTIACYMPCKGGCRNGGTCLGYLGCKCPVGYGGKRCERAMCILPCLHRGRCVAPYQCACPRGYTGSRCQSAICDPPCENRGICEQPNVCRCQHGFQGPRCESSDLRTFERAARARKSTTTSTTAAPGWSWR